MNLSEPCISSVSPARPACHSVKCISPISRNATEQLIFCKLISTLIYTRICICIVHIYVYIHSVLLLILKHTATLIPTDKFISSIIWTSPSWCNTLQQLSTHCDNTVLRICHSTLWAEYVCSLFPKCISSETCTSRSDCNVSRHTYRYTHFSLPPFPPPSSPFDCSPPLSLSLSLLDLIGGTLSRDTGLVNIHRTVLQCVAVCYSVLQCVARLSDVQVLLETHLR